MIARNNHQQRRLIASAKTIASYFHNYHHRTVNNNRPDKKATPPRTKVRNFLKGPLRFPFSAFFLFLLSFCFPPSAFASCTNPAGQAGQMIYSSDYHVPQYCNGGTWVAMGTAGVPGSILNGLVGWWKLDDGSSGTTPITAADSSGNGNTGTLTNSAVWTSSGKISNALTVNGTNQQVSIPSLGLSSTFSFSFWVKSTTASGSNMFSIGNYIYCEANYSSGDIAACSPDNSAHVITAGGLMDGNWHHVAYVSTGAAATQLLYVDGILQGTVTATPNLSGGSAATIASQNGSNYFQGTIDDVRVYDRALSASEITDLYHWGVNVAPSTGLVGWWKLDEASGTSASDSSGNGNTGTVTPNATGVWVAGKINNAANLNGTTQQVNLPYNAAQVLPAASAFTVSAWVKPSNLGGGFETILDQNPTGGNDNYFLEINANQADCGFHGQPVNGFQIITMTGTLSNNNWYHLACVYDRTAHTLSIYVNGTLNNSMAETNNLDTNTGPSYIGTGNGSQWFAGTIDDVRVYNRALSASEITQIYNGGSGSNSDVAVGLCSNPTGNEGDLLYSAGTHHVLQYCGVNGWQALGPDPGAGGAGCASPAGVEGDVRYNTDYHVMQYCDGTNWAQMPKWGSAPANGLVGWWNFDEGSGTSAADSSGNSNTGTLTNGPTWTASGKINGALSFNGTNQDVHVTTATDLIGGGPATVSAWIYPVAYVAGGGYIIANWEVVFYLSSGCDCVGFSSDNQTHNVPSAANSVPLNQWTLVTAARDAAGTTNVYINGVLSSAANQFSGTPLAGYNGTIIGNRDGDATPFNGKIDDVRVYNRALSAPEILRLYNGQ
jgi:hypothetical protein